MMNAELKERLRRNFADAVSASQKHAPRDFRTGFDIISGGALATPILRRSRTFNSEFLIPNSEL